MIRFPAVLAVATAMAAVSSCASSGTAETDRQAQTLADAISWPRQHSAAGFARAALATTLGRSTAFAVLEMKDLHAPTLTDPLAHLVIRLHYPPTDGKFGRTDEVLACYRMHFNYHGIIGAPESIKCPENALPITPPEYPSFAKPAVFDNRVESVLAALPAEIDQHQVFDALKRADLIDTVADPETETRDPRLDLTVSGQDVGVSYLGSDGACLLGSRVQGGTRVWRPQGHPCTPAAALANLGAP